MEKYRMTPSAVYCFINSNGIPSKRVKRTSYYSKKHVDILKQDTLPQSTDYYTVEECMAHYGYSRDQVYHYLRYYIIGTPYRYVSAEDRYFDLGKGVRGWSHGREVTFHPRITDERILMMATARWLIWDEQHRSSRFIDLVQETCKAHPDCGYSPFMQRWAEAENPRRSAQALRPPTRRWPWGRRSGWQVTVGQRTTSRSPCRTTSD